MKISKILTVLFLFSLFGCGEDVLDENKDEEKIVYVVCDIEKMKNKECSRFMDRKIYLPRSYNSQESVDLEFAKDNFKEALNAISTESIYLGSNYFEYPETDERLMNPITSLDVRASEFNSFVLFWNSTRFNQYIEDNDINPSDPNSIFVINKANKRQFWIIFRMECFLNGDSGHEACTSNASEEYTSTKGTRALVARTFSRMVGEPYVDCNANSTDFMCPLTPKDAQWDSLPKIQSNITRLDNRLELIASYLDDSDGDISTFWDVTTIENNLDDQQ
jgi:hypothetical protein